MRYRPFTGDQDRRIRLDAAPLELVLCQVRWPQVSSLQGDLKQVVAAFGELIPEYPLYASNTEFSFELTPAGPVQAPGNVLHHWSRADRSATVTLSPNFVTLSAKQYEGYDAFASQLESVLLAIQETLKLPLFDRVGVRYVNRISNLEQLEKIQQLVKPELLGHQALNAVSGEVSLVQAITQSLFQVGDGYLQARSGVIPPGETVDPSVEPLQTPSWVLDIDSFRQEEALYTPDAVLARAGKLSDAAYDFFKLVIQEAFIDEFEGTTL